MINSLDVNNKTLILKIKLMNKHYKVINDKSCKTIFCLFHFPQMPLITLYDWYVCNIVNKHG